MQLETAARGMNGSMSYQDRGLAPVAVWRPDAGRDSGASVARDVDSQLIRRAQEGDHAAFAELVRRYDRAVLRLALQMTGCEHQAHDIYQEAFLKVYRKLKTFDFRCTFYTWVYRIVVNACLDQFRREKVRSEVGAAPVRSSDGTEIDQTVLDRLSDSRPHSNPEKALLAREMGRQIARAFRRLTARERMAIELRHYEGVKIRNVALMMNTSEASVKNLLFRATVKLRTALAPVR